MEIQKLYQQAIKFASSKHAAMGQKVPGTATARILSRGIYHPLHPDVLYFRTKAISTPSIKTLNN